MSTKLPSRFAHGDNVAVNLFECGFLKNGEIEKVHFSEDKVSYDVCFTIKRKHGDDILTSYAVLCDVDSAFVQPAVEEEGIFPALGEITKPDRV